MPVNPRPRRGIDPGLLVVLILPLFAISPLLKSGLPGLADATIHLLRTVELDFLWRNGVFFPRWAPNMAFGYGYPLFDFAPPLPYIIAETFHLLGADFETAIKLLSILCFYLACLGMYLFSRELLDPGPALLAAAAYIYTPFVFREQLIYGGNYPQILAVSLYPWGLWAWARLHASGRWRYAALAALSLAAVVLSHLFHIVAFGGLIGAYLAFLVLTGRRQTRLAGRTVAAGLALGAGLTAYFLIPVVVDRQWTRAQADYYLQHSDFRQRFLSLSDLVAWPAPLDGAAANPPLPFSLSPPLLALALIAVLGLPLLWRRRASLARHVGFFALLLGGAVFMMTPLSTALWRDLFFLAVAEFPWRLMGLAILAVAFLAGAGWQVASDWLRPRRAALTPLARAAGFGAVFAVALLAVAPYLYPPAPFVEYDNPTLADGIRYELTGLAIGTTNLAEYLPQWVEEAPATSPLVEAYLTGQPVDKLDRAALPPGVAAEALAHTPLTDRYRFRAAAPFLAQFHTFYFPGWQATVDGRPAEIEIRPPLGLIGVEVPAGEHEVALRFVSLPHQTASNAISLLAVVGLLAAVLADRRQKGGTANAAGAASGAPAGGQRLDWAGAGAAGGLLLALFLFKLLVVDGGTSWFRAQSPPGEVLGVQYPAGADFGGEIRLIGYDVSSTVLRPGDTLRVRLYWQALKPIERHYSTFVHLDTFPPVETQAGSDHFSPGDPQAQIDVPTTAWNPATYVRDEHTLVIPAGLPPVAYQLRAGLYELETGRRLPGPDDGVALLATVHLQAARQPRPAALPNAADFQLGPAIHLLGYELAGSPGATFSCSLSRGDCSPAVDLYWRADAPPAGDYTVFVQLVDERGRIWGQGDGPPLGGAYPTSRWLPGQLIADRHSLVLDPAIPPGAYRLLAGLYRPDTLARLPVSGPAGPVPDSAIPLAPLSIRVEP